MKKYFYLENKKQLGPFTIEELKEKGIRKDTMVWYKGMAEWKKAEELPELKDILGEDEPVSAADEKPKEVTPPQDKGIGQKTINLLGNEIKMPVFFVLAAVLLIVIVVAIWLIAANTGGSGGAATDDTEMVADSSAYYSGEDPEGEGASAVGEYEADRIAEDEAIKDIIDNYWKYYKVNVQYETKMLGGLKNIIVTLTNDSPFDVKSLTVAVEYLSKKDKSFDKVYVKFTDIAGGSKESRIIEDSKKGKKAKAYIVRIDVPEIGLVK